MYIYDKLGGEGGMTMLKEMTFTDARYNLTEVIDKSLQFQPTIIRPRKKSEDGNIVMRLGMLRTLLDDLEAPEKIAIEFFQEEDGSVTLSIDPFEIVLNEPTREKAIESAVNEVIDYAKDYLNEFSLYHNSKNRRSHFAHVIKILLCDTKEQVAELIGIA
jgi:hypothetical protein